MNERIKELLKQAGVKYTIMPKDTVYEKFAELIVNECCATIANTDRYRSEYFIAIIKEHFGVEE